ncbi:MAG: endonuclease/exonuclease/phosphatase family protein [Planctomycetota bacterium]
MAEEEQVHATGESQELPEGYFRRKSSSANRKQMGLRERCSILVNWATAGVLVQTICHLLGFVHAFLELASHCCVHVLCFGVLLLPLLFWMRRRKSALAVAVCCAVLASYVQPWNLYLPVKHPIQGESQLKVLSWNILSRNKRIEDVVRLVKKSDADLVVLIEARPGIMELIPELLEEYPIHLERPSWAGEGIAMLSRIEGTTMRFEDFTWPRQPAIIADLPAQNGQADGESLQLVGMHALSPVPLSRTKIRDEQLEALGEWAVKQETPVCVCGDLNITPWASPFRQLIQLGFRDSREGRGNCPTWPSKFGAFGIPIDHVLCRGSCDILNREVLSESPGSDHRPILFTVDY